ADPDPLRARVRPGDAPLEGEGDRDAGQRELAGDAPAHLGQLAAQLEPDAARREIAARSQPASSGGGELHPAGERRRGPPLLRRLSVPGDPLPPSATAPPARADTWSEAASCKNRADRSRVGDPGGRATASTSGGPCGDGERRERDYAVA